MLAEASPLDYSSPDKKLESSYDDWAVAHLMAIAGDSANYWKYRRLAENYKIYWEKDFADLSCFDIDRMHARGLYQGTVWQYRWFVPFDVQGLKQLSGGDRYFIRQLDHFFQSGSHNHANEPDIQAPGLYNATSEPWKSQALIH